MSICPICLSVDGFSCTNGDRWGVGNTRHECEICGIFGTSWEARDDYLGAERSKTTAYVRAVLSHWIQLRQAIRNSDYIPLVTSEIVEAAISGELKLPNPSEQASNIIQFIGDQTRFDVETLEEIPPKFHAVVGSIRRRTAMQILFELRDQNLLCAMDASSMDHYDAMDVRLTLHGWNQYEAEQTGRTTQSYGFIALKFSDPILDPFVRDHVRPTIESLGFGLHDLRDLSEAGIIDNIMRVKIRDAAFVIVDLTHDNYGAYWEAGYAEGLGKPVLYICERTKFHEKATHFDTNHCTTVLWDHSNPTDFTSNLAATLKRTLAI